MSRQFVYTNFVLTELYFTSLTRAVFSAVGSRNEKGVKIVVFKKPFDFRSISTFEINSKWDLQTLKNRSE